MLNAWKEVLTAPINSRLAKPRDKGLTMILDKGLSLQETVAWLKLTQDYVDFIKLTFGTSALYPVEELVKKIRLIRKAGIKVFPGGTLLEIAIYQGKAKDFLDRALDLGFDALEISDGAISFDLHAREKMIKLAQEKGFYVLTEIGKKLSQENINIPLLLQLAKFDLEHGSKLVIVEGRESGKGVGIYNQDGGIEENRLENLAENLPLEQILWEAPLKNQQVELVRRFGANVNLGNIAPQEVYALESLRLGIRGDTLIDAIRSENMAQTQ